MRLLLDTHTFLWFIEGSLNLSDVARDLIEDQANQRFLSVASLWEMSIKVSIGKLELGMTFIGLTQIPSFCPPDPPTLGGVNPVPPTFGGLGGRLLKS
jgi:hypothetical protein